MLKIFKLQLTDNDNDKQYKNDFLRNEMNYNNDKIITSKNNKKKLSARSILKNFQ